MVSASSNRIRLPKSARLSREHVPTMQTGYLDRGPLTYAGKGWNYFNRQSALRDVRGLGKLRGYSWDERTGEDSNLQPVD